LKYITNEIVKQSLSRATSEQKIPIFEQLEIVPVPGYPNEHIVRRVCRLGEHGFRSLFSDEEPCSYLKFLHNLLQQLDKRTPTLYDQNYMDDVELGRGASRGRSWSERRKELLGELNRLESLLFSLILQRAYESLSPSQKSEFEKELARTLYDQDVGYKIKSGGVAALMVTGELAGFSAYTALSTLIHTMTMGSAGFGVYTTASSLLSYALGPIGWSTLAGYFVYRSGAPKLKQLLPVGLAIGVMEKH
jgi:hypothetical protein